MNVDHEEVFEVEGLRVVVCHSNGCVALQEGGKDIADLTTAPADQQAMLLALSEALQKAAKAVSNGDRK